MQVAKITKHRRVCVAQIYLFLQENTSDYGIKRVQLMRDQIVYPKTVEIFDFDVFLDGFVGIDDFR